MAKGARGSKASARRRTRARASGSRPTMEELKDFVRTEGVRYLRAKNVNSVGIGRKISAAKGPTGEVCIQFTVDRKIAPEALAAVDTILIPPFFVINGKTVPSDVIERRFRHGWQLVAESEIVKEDRKARQDTVSPGLSVGHHEGTAGTVGAIVFDRETGAPLLLSNWHVLQMRADDSAGEIGDAVVQPGPFDDNQVAANVVGRLVRSHLGPAGDCAVASIEGRGFRSEVFELKTPIARIGRAELDDAVVKSGRTTAVTRGIVTRVEVQTQMRYGELDVIVGGFEIGPDANNPAPMNEISKGGDSGAAWLAVDPKTGRPTDVMLGLHFAGEATDDQPEFAMACAAHSVFEKLSLSLTPGAALGGMASGGGVVVERLFGGPGYDPSFIGVSLPLPSGATKTVRDDLIGADGKKVANYTHFSLSMRKSRRLAAFVAWNIDGRITKPSSKDAGWTTDPRIPTEFQIDNTLYEGTKFDRGHIAKREDLLWGGAGVAKRANDDSFCYTNSTPQHEKFNRLAPALWKSLEDELFRQVDIANLKIALVGGPIFRSDDRLFTPSAAPQGWKPVRIPREFWKIVAYRDAADNRAKVLAFTLSQASLIGGRLEALAPESLDLEKFEMYQVKVTELEALTGLALPAFRRLDVIAAREAVAPEALAPRRVAPIRAFSDIIR
jgi:endonuclease G